MYLIAFPLLLIPLVLYHMVAFLLELPLETALFAVPVLSGTSVAVNIGEALVMLAVLLLYVEFLKFSRLAARSVMGLGCVKTFRRWRRRARTNARMPR
jgi:hypothetical protein